MAMEWLTNMFRRIIVKTITDAEKQVSEPNIVTKSIDDENPMEHQECSAHSWSDLMSWSDGVQSKADLYTATYSDTFDKHGADAFSDPERKKSIDDGLRRTLAHRAAFLRMVSTIRQLENIPPGKQYRIHIGSDVYSLTGSHLNDQLPHLLAIEQATNLGDALFDRFSSALAEIEKANELLKTQQQLMREAKDGVKATEPKKPSLGTLRSLIFKRQQSELEQAQQKSICEAACDNLKKAEATVAATEAEVKRIQATIDDVRFPQRREREAPRSTPGTPASDL